MTNPLRWRDLGNNWSALYDVNSRTGHVNSPRRGSRPIGITVDEGGKVALGRQLPSSVTIPLLRWIAEGAPPDAG